MLAPKSLAMALHYKSLVQVAIFCVISAQMSLMAWKAAPMFALLRSLAFEKLLESFIGVLSILVHDHSGDTGVDNLEGVVGNAGKLGDGANKVHPVSSKDAWSEGEGPDSSDSSANTIKKKKLGRCAKCWNKSAVKLGLLMAKQSMILVPLIEIGGQYLQVFFEKAYEDRFEGDAPVVDVKSWAIATSVFISCVWLMIILKPFLNLLSREWNLWHKFLCVEIMMITIGVQPVILMTAKPKIDGLADPIALIIWENMIIMFEMVVAVYLMNTGFRFTDFILIGDEVNQKYEQMKELAEKQGTYRGPAK